MLLLHVILAPLWWLTHNLLLIPLLHCTVTDRPSAFTAGESGPGVPCSPEVDALCEPVAEPGCA